MAEAPSSKDLVRDLPSTIDFNVLCLSNAIGMHIESFSVVKNLYGPDFAQHDPTPNPLSYLERHIKEFYIALAKEKADLVTF